MSTRLIIMATIWNLIHTGNSLDFGGNTKVSYVCSRVIGDDDSCTVLELDCGKQTIKVSNTIHMRRGRKDRTCNHSINGKCKQEGQCCSFHSDDDVISSSTIEMISRSCDRMHSCSFKNPVCDFCVPGDHRGISYLYVEYICITDTNPPTPHTWTSFKTTRLTAETSRYSTLSEPISFREVTTLSQKTATNSTTAKSRRKNTVAIVIPIVIVVALGVIGFFLWKIRSHIWRLTRGVFKRTAGSSLSNQCNVNLDQLDRQIALENKRKQASDQVEESGNEYSTIDLNNIRVNTLVSEKSLNSHTDSQTDAHSYFVLEPEFITRAFNADNINIDDATTGSVQTHPENEYNRIQFNAKDVSKDETYSHINSGQSRSSSSLCETDEYSNISTVQKAHLKRMDYSHVVLREEQSEDHYSHLNNEPRHFKNTWNNP